MRKDAVRTGGEGRHAKPGFITAFGVLPALLALLPSLLLAQAEVRSTWPDDLRISGSILLAGGGDVPDEAFARFRQLAGDDEARVLVLSIDAAPTAERRAAEPFQMGQAARIEYWRASEASGGFAGLANALTEFTGLWLEGSPAPDLLGSNDIGQLADAVQTLLRRGGVVGASGSAAALLGQVAITGGERHASIAAGLGVFPGAIIELEFEIPDRRNRLLSAMASNPGLVGIGIEDGAVLQLAGRRLSVLGSGAATLLLNATETKPIRTQRLTAGSSQGRGPVADLTAWRRDAIDRTLPAFPEPAPQPPELASGTLFIVGGGGTPRGLMDRFIEAAGGSEARLVFVPAAEADEVNPDASILRQWRQAGVASATLVHTKDRERADSDEDFLAPLREATGIWFGGGRQWNFSDSYYGTAAHRLMHEVLERGGAIGGSSAGASIQARYMARGDPLGNRNIIAPGYERGLGFITGVAIDQHFTERGRQRDMEELVTTYPQLLGIGIDEATAIIVQGTIAEVVGRSGVYFYDQLSAPDARPVTPLILTEGMRYDLIFRKILPDAGR